MACEKDGAKSEAARESVAFRDSMRILERQLTWQRISSAVVFCAAAALMGGAPTFIVYKILSAALPLKYLSLALPCAMAGAGLAYLSRKIAQDMEHTQGEVVTVDFKRAALIISMRAKEPEAQLQESVAADLLASDRNRLREGETTPELERELRILRTPAEMRLEAGVTKAGVQVSGEVVKKAASSG
jgi:hypothetical protein